MSVDPTLSKIKEFLSPYLDAVLIALVNDPHHIIIESGLALFIIWLLFIRRTVNPTMEARNRLSAKEMEWLVETWTPEPLVPYTEPKEFNIIEHVNGNYLKIRGIDEEVLNLNTFDFLGYSRLNELKIASQDALEKYGCGSCGPRGFYGTIDVHIKFEHEIAAFMGCEEAISYSDSASAVSSSLPAFAKKGDLLLVDSACNEALLTAVKLSRSTVFYFKHNDMADLRQILESIADDDIALKRDKLQQRRFIVVEGIYRNTGAICPLPELLALKAEFFYRICVDESLSFGVLGPNGKGISDYFNVPVTSLDVLTVAMDCALASVGGVCVGTREIVDHQRLAGAGYCFSASAPPFLSAAAVVTLHKLKTDPSAVKDLQQVVHEFCASFDQIKGLTRITADMTPVVHLALEEQLDHKEESAVLSHLVKIITRRGLRVSFNGFPPDEMKRLVGSGHRQTLRVIAHSCLSKQEIVKAAGIVQSAVDEVLNSRRNGSFYPTY